VLGLVSSTYRWEGTITQAEEWLCLLKTTAAHYDALEQAIRALHSYTLPGILAIPVSVLAGGAASTVALRYCPVPRTKIFGQD
jgi:periplasmic divalent cation tolerance protein